jgi:hypothetical protein
LETQVRRTAPAAGRKEKTMLDVRGPADRPQLALPRRRARCLPRIRLGHQARLALRALWIAVLVGLLVLHGEPEPRPHPGPARRTALPPADLPLHAP